MSERASSALSKELRALGGAPVHHIAIVADESDLHKWYCLVYGLRDEFDGGLYCFAMTAPEDWPDSPPVLWWLTPNGVYTPGTRICVSIGHYHSDSWRPAIGMGGMAREVGFNGLLSREDLGEGIGIIANATPESIRALAAKSSDANRSLGPKDLPAGCYARLLERAIRDATSLRLGAEMCVALRREGARTVGPGWLALDRAYRRVVAGPAAGPSAVAGPSGPPQPKAPPKPATRAGPQGVPFPGLTPFVANSAPAGRAPAPLRIAAPPGPAAHREPELATYREPKLAARREPELAVHRGPELAARREPELASGCEFEFGLPAQTRGESALEPGPAGNRGLELGPGPELEPEPEASRSPGRGPGPKLEPEPEASRSPGRGAEPGSAEPRPAESHEPDHPDIFLLWKAGEASGSGFSRDEVYDLVDDVLFGGE